MIIKTKLKRAVSVSLVLFPLLGTAAEQKLEMSKDVWIGKIKEVVPEPICKGFLQDKTIAERLKERNIDLEKCKQLIPGITDKCVKKFYDKLPDTITQENVSKWGHSIGECIGADFVINYVFTGEQGTDAKAKNGADGKMKKENKN